MIRGRREELEIEICYLIKRILACKQNFHLFLMMSVVAVTVSEADPYQDTTFDVTEQGRAVELEGLARQDSDYVINVFASHLHFALNLFSN